MSVGSFSYLSSGGCAHTTGADHATRAVSIGTAGRRSIHETLKDARALQEVVGNDEHNRVNKNSGQGSLTRHPDTLALGGKSEENTRR